MRTDFSLLLACGLFTPCVLAAQGTTFSYQGRLNAGDSPASGLYEMNFTLYDTPTNGNVVGTPVTVAPLSVSNGLFTAALDFGAAAFTGADRWLEIAVTVFGSDQPVVTLQPRQSITPTPSALHAANAAGLMSFASAPLDIQVNGRRALRLESTAGGTLNLVAGSASNSISAAVGATISGGGSPALPNVIAGANYGTVAGGERQRIALDSHWSSVGGGFMNTVGEVSIAATIAGGYENSIASNAPFASISGGTRNFVGGRNSHIGGGDDNVVSAEAGYSTIGGGTENQVQENADGSIIGGGSENVIGPNAPESVIAGGLQNLIESNATLSAIGGGGYNAIGESANSATIGGGSDNKIAVGAFQSTLSGGGENEIQDGAFYSTIGGGLENIVRPRAISSTIAGGFHNQIQTNATNGTIAGGGNNAILVGSILATIGGGGFNRAGGFGATIAGGGGFSFDGSSAGNTAGARWSTVGGGALNAALGTNSTVGGGSDNVARGESATIPGGYGNNADGAYSFAAGENAFADHAGAFVWSDASLVALHSTTNNQFTARASGGVRFFTDPTATAGAELAPGSGAWSSVSDRNAKENFAPANPREILDKVTTLPMASWNYKAQGAAVRHLGPMAQDFHAAFGLGESERTITTVDADGVALAAIQGLNTKLEEELKAKDARLAELERRLAGIERLLITTAAK
jgi:hypothetical protein